MSSWSPQARVHRPRSLAGDSSSTACAAAGAARTSRWWSAQSGGGWSVTSIEADDGVEGQTSPHPATTPTSKPSPGTWPCATSNPTPHCSPPKDHRKPRVAIMLGGHTIWQPSGARGGMGRGKNRPTTAARRPSSLTSDAHGSSARCTHSRQARSAVGENGIDQPHTDNGYTDSPHKLIFVSSGTACCTACRPAPDSPSR